jgi:DHA1 family bicyclomycin/chloramphenicol resistance-like MFS transporter
MAKNVTVRFLDRTTPPHIFTLILLAGVSALAMNVFLPSLPGMAAHFETDYRIMQLSVAVYLLVNAVLQIFFGPISDKYGRRPVILWGVALFVVASVGCLLATTVEIFLFFRMCQSVVATGLVLSRAAVRDMYPPAEAASMIGYVTAGMAVVPMVGPMAGGFLDTAFGWQGSFWLLVILGLLAFALAWRDFGETARSSGLSLAQQFGEYPELLRSPRFWGYAMATATTAGTFFAYLGGAPYVGTEVFGLDAATLGLFFGAPAVGYFVGNFASGRFSTRFGINNMVLWGCVLNMIGAGLSLVFFEVGIGTEYSFFGLMTIVGFGNGIAMPNGTSGMMSVRPHLAGTASGLGGSMMLAGGAGLSGLAGLLLTEDSGPFPLLWIMFLTAAVSVLCILLVIRRERRLTM